jgi:transposase
MLSIAPPPTIYLHAGATDMRKSFDGLSGIIRGSFGGDPADGSLFLFVNKRRDRLKALWWDGDGFALWYKRLEQGTFESVGGYERRKPGTEKPRSEALPAHLPRSEVKLPVPADLKECAPQGV